MVKLFISLSIALVLVISGTVFVGAASSGRIEGQIVNMTAGSTGSVANLSVILQVFQGNSQTDQKAAVSDAQGKFSFDGLDNSTALSYQIQTSYSDVKYFSDAVVFNAGENLKTTQISVYDTTSDGTGIGVDMSHVILSLSGATLNVKENYIFGNTSDLTFIGANTGLNGQRATLNFWVPSGAKSVAASIGLLKTPDVQPDGSFTDAVPVPPGGVFISYTYKLDVVQDSLSMTWKFNYDTARFDLLIDSANIKLSSDKLNQEQSLVISGKSYQDYSANAVKKGDLITAQLKGLTGSGTGGLASGSAFNLVWLWLLLIPAIGLLALVLVRRNKSRSATTGSVTVSGNDHYEEEKARLMREIAELDDSFENDDIEEAEYKRLRQEKKQQILNLPKTDEGKDGPV